MGWTEAMAAQADDASRRALQAAWRKLERTGLRRLREAAKKFYTGCPEAGGNDTEWRMTAAVGHPTLRLVRVAIGDLRMPGLAPGEWRDLTAAEIAGLKR